MEKGETITLRDLKHFNLQRVSGNHEHENFYGLSETSGEADILPLCFLEWILWNFCLLTTMKMEWVISFFSIFSWGDSSCITSYTTLQSLSWVQQSEKNRLYYVNERNSVIDVRKVDKDGGVKKWVIIGWLTLKVWILTSYQITAWRSMFLEVCFVSGVQKHYYVRGGKRDLLRHAKRLKDHLPKKKCCLKNTILPSSWTGRTEDALICENRKSCNVPHGAAKSICNSTVYFIIKRLWSALVSLVNQHLHMEAFFVSFVAEISFSFSFADKLVKFTQECVRCPTIVNAAQIWRHIEAYKLSELQPV